MKRHLAIILSITALVFASASWSQVTVGEHVPTRLETSHPYTSSGADDPVLTWSKIVDYPGAVYIAVHFARFELAPGDYVVVRSEDSAQKWTYRHLGRRNLGVDPEGFFATHIKGDTAIVELYTQGDSAGWGVKIDRFGRGYNDAEIEAFWAAGLGEKMNLPRPAGDQESVCTTDDTREAKCYEGSDPDAYDKGRAVARLLQNGSVHCTGWLVGCEGHIMTNEHCIGSQSQANNIDFEFMAEGADCATNCASAGACPGTIEASGGTLIAVDAPLDYALVLPDTTVGGDTDLPGTYGYMQLRESGAVQDERIYIAQHPAGWGKRFAMESTYPEDAGLGGNTYATSLTEPACSGGPVEVGYWADTQGGSSGSPVLGYADHRVVALHHCRGSDSCTTGTGSDDRNRGVAIQNVIADLGDDLPNCATCQPPDAPTNVVATPNGDNQIDVTWDAVVDATSYVVYRAIGSCPQTQWEEIANGVAGTTFSDTDVSGNTTYSYAIAAFVDATSCESDRSACDDADATGLCTLAPTFDGLVSAQSAGDDSCGATLDWNAGSSACGASVVYNIYRSETSGFIPGPSNLLTSCVSGTSYLDTDVEYGVEGFYVVRAEDDSGNGTGACASGNEDGNTAEDSATPAGPDTEHFVDDLEAAPTGWSLSAGPADTGTSPWAPVTDQSHSPTTSLFVSDEPIVKDQIAELSSSIVLPAAPAVLEFWHSFNTENNWDGGVLEISTNGTTWVDILDGNASRFLQGGYSGTLSTGTGTNPLAGRDAWFGNSGGWILTQVDLGDFAGQEIWLRWRMGCDSSVSAVGWWLDDVRIFAGNVCLSNLLFADGFESGNSDSWSATRP